MPIKTLHRAIWNVRSLSIQCIIVIKLYKPVDHRATPPLKSGAIIADLDGTLAINTSGREFLRYEPYRGRYARSIRRILD